MLNLKDLSQAALLQMVADKTLSQDAIKKQIDDLKAELLKRQMITGEVAFEANGWASTMVKERFSESWLKRETGYEVSDLPGHLIKEKIVPDVDWEGVNNYLREEGYIVETGYTLRINKKKVK